MHKKRREKIVSVDHHLLVKVSIIPKEKTEEKKEESIHSSLTWKRVNQFLPLFISDTKAGIG